MPTGAMLCVSFREAGYRLLLLTATVEDDGYRESLPEASDAPERLIVRFEAEPSTLEGRWRAREPATWSGWKR